MSNHTITTEAVKTISPFILLGTPIVKVSAERSIVSGRVTFQACGTAWGDGAYSRDYLVACGAVESEIDAIICAVGGTP